MSATDLWHLDPEDIDRYVRGHASPALEASVDAHLLHCSRCQGATSARIAELQPTRNDMRWAAIADEIDRPRPSIVEVLLTRIGLSDVDVRALVATPRLVAAWLASLALTLAMAILANGATNGRLAVTLFLIAAPILPMVGTALLYSPSSEPPGAIAMATPGRGPRLLMMRSLFVLATSVPALLVAGALVPGPSSVAVAWLLPGLGLTLTALALSRLWDPFRIALLLGAAWAVAVTIPALDLARLPLAVFARQLLPLQPATQIAFALVAAIAGSFLLVQHKLLPSREIR